MGGNTLGTLRADDSLFRYRVVTDVDYITALLFTSHGEVPQMSSLDLLETGRGSRRLKSMPSHFQALAFASSSLRSSRHKCHSSMLS